MSDIQINASTLVVAKGVARCKKIAFIAETLYTSIMPALTAMRCPAGIEARLSHHLPHTVRRSREVYLNT